jgi:hypothetical protein
MKLYGCPRTSTLLPTNSPAQRTAQVLSKQEQEKRKCTRLDLVIIVAVRDFATPFVIFATPACNTQEFFFKE